MKKIIILSPTLWSEPKRLRRQLAELLAKNMEVIYITLPFAFRNPEKTGEESHDRVRVVNLAGPNFPLRIILSSRSMRFFYCLKLKWEIKKIIPSISQADVIFSFVYSYPELLRLAPNAKKIYVANDDHSAIATSRKFQKTIKEHEFETISLCDAILSVSKNIAKKFESLKKPSYLMYPGHDCVPLPVSQFKLSEVGLRSACFMGFIDWRIDFKLIRRLLEQGWSVTFFGPVIGTEDHIKALSRDFEKSFFVKDSIDTRNASTVLSKYQILIMPYKFRSHEQRDAIELPNKVFIYFSALRPVIATFMPNLQFVSPGLIYMETPGLNFIDLCTIAIEDDNSNYIAARYHLASNNTWDSRIEYIDEIIND